MDTAFKGITEEGTIPQVQVSSWSGKRGLHHCSIIDKMRGVHHFA